MLIRGSCHCGNISFELNWLPDPTEIPARACNCSFCTKLGGVWTSLPTGYLRISIEEPALVSKYGTRQRAFLTTLIDRIDVGADQIDIHLRLTRLAALLDVAATPPPSATDDENSNLVHPGAVTPLGAGDQDVDRGDRPDCHSET